MTQTEVAKIFKLSCSAVNYWEMGLSVPSAQYIVNLAKLFNVSTDYILGIDNEHSTVSVSGLNEKQVEAVCNIINCFRESNEKV